MGLCEVMWRLWVRDVEVGCDEEGALVLEILRVVAVVCSGEGKASVLVFNFLTDARICRIFQVVEGIFLAFHFKM